jgi:uncharacterized membrane protein
MSKAWEPHPTVRSGKELTIGERAADLVRNGMGSWAFVFVFSAFMTVWMVMNDHHGFDPFPYILLNLMLSTLAAIQGAILLIAAKRADTVAAEQALAHYEVSKADLASDQSTNVIVRKIAAHLGVEVE